MIFAAVNVLLAAIAVALLLPVALVALQVAAALLPLRARGRATAATRPRVAVLVPAHNEAAGIAPTLENVAAQLRAGGRVLVVADNCADETARVARACGAQVLERAHDTLRGKGYALDAGVRHLAADPPDVVVVMDADVRLQPGSLDALVEQAARTGRPAQAIYLLAENAQQDGRDVVSRIAFTIKNHVRPLGLARLGGPCPLFGTGMAFPWDVLRDAPLASGNLVEDIALALDLAERGRAPRLCPAAFVDGELPATDAAALKQRRRWEHGHLSTILTQVPKALARGVLRGRPGAVALALDLAVPPLSLLVVALVGAALAATVAAWASPRVALWPAWALWAGTGVLALALLAGYFRFVRCDRKVRRLIAVPGYVARKLPLYAGFLTRRQKAWERTDRANEAGKPADAR